jgi:hypothetical protein
LFLAASAPPEPDDELASDPGCAPPAAEDASAAPLAGRAEPELDAPFVPLAPNEEAPTGNEELPPLAPNGALPDAGTVEDVPVLAGGFWPNVPPGDWQCSIVPIDRISVAVAGASGPGSDDETICRSLPTQLERTS